MEKQRELFNEFKDAGSGGKAFTKGFLPGRSFSIIFTYERLILTSLGCLVALLITFAFGFECGKKSGFEQQVPVQVLVPHRVAMMPAPQVAHVPASVEPPRQAPIRRPQAVIPPRPIAKPLPYTILAATYRSKDLAQQETALLRGKGFPASMIMNGSFYQVLVGDYADVKTATATLNALRKSHADCLIKKK